jgi:pimeloyl-ACP methyl ester carboxylesterase
MTRSDLEVVFLHGQPGQKEDFALVSEWLEPRLRLRCLDRPGWGSNPLGVIGIEGNAQWVARQFETRRVLLIGHSLGATIAVRTAQLFPDRVAGLILIAPPITQRSLVAIDRLLAARFIGQMTSALIAGVSLGPARRAQFRRTRRSFLAEQRHLLGELRLVEGELPLVVCPSVVIVGVRDRVVPLAAMAQAAQHLADAQLEVLPSAGHDVLHVAPIETAAVVRGMIGRLEAIGEEGGWEAGSEAQA